MAYVLGEDGLLDFTDCISEEEKRAQCWDYFKENLADSEVIAFDGTLVRGFTEVSFNHIISGSSNRYDTALGHDIDLDERRARCLPLIAKVIRGEIKSQCYRVFKRRGKRTSVRRVLAVVEAENRYYVVVLIEERGHYKILTAYPSGKSYYDRRIKGNGVNWGTWGV